jgi:membrane protein
MLTLTRTILRRTREERLVQVAGSLTFTTVLSAVPLLAASFALLTRFPLLGGLQQAIHDVVLRGLLPAAIAHSVLQHLARFAANAGALTLLGFLFVLATALLLLLAVENALNRIWQVRKDRPLLKRVGLYLLLLAIGPLLLGASLWATSHAVRASAGLVGALPPSLAFVLNLAPVVLGTLAWAALFYFVPNTPVRRRDAIAGGLLASIGFELGKRGFAAYLLHIPTYKAVYGAFATLPLFLLWVYFSWLVTLAAALVASSLAGAARPPARRGPARAKPGKGAP